MEKIELENGFKFVRDKEKSNKINVFHQNKAFEGTHEELVMVLFNELQKLKANYDYDMFMNGEEVQWGYNLYELLLRTVPYIPEKTKMYKEINSVIDSMNV